MNELSRQAYLDALGVDAYFPRAALSGALASPQCLITLQTVTVTGTAEDVAANSGATDSYNDSRTEGTNAAKALFSDQDQDQDQNQTVTKAPLRGDSPSSEPALDSQPLPEFCYLFAKAENFLLVSVAVSGQEAGDYQQLVSNLLLALGEQRAGVELEIFQWPMIKSSAIDQGAAVARDYLASLLAERLNTKTLLLFGETANYMPFENTERGCLHHDKGLQVNYLLSHCLAEAFAKPALKAEIWQDLLPLRQV